MVSSSYSYTQPDPVTEQKVDALLGQMTLAEKVGQLVLSRATLHGPQVDPAAEVLARQGLLSAVICDLAPVNNRLQRLALEESRLHIPLLIGADVIHGYRTTFPIPLAEACTWNPDLLERAAQVAAREASTTGVNWIFAPMVDLARDPRWGRIAEGAGEDPFLGKQLAQARVRGFQTADLPVPFKIAACPKHFAGYGAAEAGRDYNSVELSERTLREVYLPPFKAAFEAGAGSTMCAFHDLAGVPASADPFLLRKVLREEWVWPGIVVSDYNSVGELVNHGIAPDLREAARLGLLAGVDLDMDSGAYLNHLASLVEEGSVPLELVDQAVRRVLRLKYNLGLFENPYVEEHLAARHLLAPEARALALEVARQSMVLLKNDGNLLPLEPGSQRIAVIGPLADNQADLLGSWASAGRAQDAEPVLTALQQIYGEENLTYARGCSISGQADLDLLSAVEAAQAADTIVLLLGESASLSGENCSRAHLGLPGRQQELAGLLAQMGKPMVAVLMCGRPLVVPELARQVDALLVAWQGGITAGQAVAEILSGQVNPSGSLTASWPRAEGQIPVYYNHKPTGRPAEGAGTVQFHEPFRSTFLDEPNAPLFAFGEGLSYSTFEFSRLEVETPYVPLGGSLRASAYIKNLSTRPGVEIAQLYVRDLVASVSRPVKELKGFQRIEIAPAEEKKVRFEVPVKELGFIGQDQKYTLEPGKFKLWIGPDSTTGLEGEFEIVA